MSDLDTTIDVPDSIPVPVPVPVPSSRRPGFALRVAAAVVAAALAGVIIGVGIIKVKYDGTPQAAAATAPTAAPATGRPLPYGAQANGTHFGSLSDLLLPVPTGYKPGPDDGADGNDSVLTPEQLAADLDDSVKDLPKTERDKAKAVLQGLKEKGEGVRTYRSTNGDMALYLRINQFNQQSVEAENAFEAAMGSETGLFRLGPQVPGHPEAHCFLPPEDPGEPIDELDCTAAVGDLLVSLHVEGVAPLPKAEAVSVFRQQLDRLALPGASA
ncbi:hypothetical protein P3T36_004953 [Kitasatospora sp. MAP12-15]|uniref:hypothetical protein n=1 Tax=unclassified Kitasatospora TaxID=2633591 RepID=UPI002473A5F8|nr:hypothetical protein [Kitasatospora sp. MAP12-44]MDH6112070.1 hypothetical protein [Kitasatospora sp. MAP12-44]